MNQKLAPVAPIISILLLIGAVGYFVFVSKLELMSETTEDTPTSTPELLPQPKGTMDMRIEGVNEENGAVKVLMTGAKFLIEHDGKVAWEGLLC